MKTKLLTLSIMFLFFSYHAFSEGFVTDRVADNAGLLSASEKEDLDRLTSSIAATYNFDLVIVTETDIGDTSPGGYAAEFYDNNGYGPNGCLFLQVTGSEDYYFSTAGRGITVLNQYAYQKLESDTVKRLGEDNSYAAFLAFVQDWDKFLSLEAKGRSYNFVYQWNIVLLIIAWLIALVIAFIIVSTWNRGMNTALPKTQAAAYVVSDSLNFTVKKDSFLHSKTDKVRLQSQQAASLVKGGARIISSSGRSHGGGGGKYGRR
jgi:uncharacterized protein